MFCAEQVAEFRPHAKTLRGSGIGTFVIGSGAPNFARGFSERMGGEIPIFSDEKRVTYQALELRRGVSTVLDPRAALPAVGALFRYGQRRTMGDANQQGGVIIVRPDGTMPYKFVSRYSGDHPKPEAVVAAALA
jgi:AhpC/TSA antioxidant enzyme